ncbi:zinc ABC transporter substrate-binding protein [Microbacterium sp. CnD16-F]|uniref:metal ABC transporter solute-binding protein, Zn/Mn family n=1 Tax=Microbacterium sp. CnD16-F TaxID=2954493 RepID=UPI002097CABA|nr:zinc ABC transporter substrate-binding protein [Microbacterium sp. CnD16-F]MCO7202833.1 zinc ABC transporter substrate-binding protein [Microbacterium sp. CnD16-F]
MTSRVPALLALSVGSVLVLAGCATATSPAAGGDGDRLKVVASTNVYGSLAQAIGGDDVEVTSIVNSLSQDPHSYEASARDQLTVSQADLVIENGGGYDAFVDALIDASGTTAPVITAVEYSHDYPGNEGHSDGAHAEGDSHAEEDHAEGDDHAGHDHIEGFNEHVWYDPHTMEHVVEDIAHELGDLDAAKADTFEANAKKLIDGVAGLETSLEKIKADHAGEKIFATEPVPLYLTAAAGLENATPEAFSEAVEEGQDVPPATMLEATKILGSGEVRTVIVNAQTGGAETSEVEGLGTKADIPVLKFTELLPDGLTYLEWMQQNIDELAGSLTR